MSQLFEGRLSATEVLHLLKEKGIISWDPKATTGTGHRNAFLFREKIRKMEAANFEGITKNDESAPVHKEGKSWSIDGLWFHQHGQQLLDVIGVKNTEVQPATAVVEAPVETQESAVSAEVKEKVSEILTAE